MRSKLITIALVLLIFGAIAGFIAFAMHTRPHIFETIFNAARSR